MSTHHLREDKNCENCGYVVELVYCPHCGQKNVETRQSFGHLVSHFAEDLTHYDAAFWRTIKYLLFRPGKLTLEYLSGKRQMYVPPVKLYIFISFVTFFLLSLAPAAFTEQHKGNVKLTSEKEYIDIGKHKFYTAEELERFQAQAAPDEKLDAFSFWMAKRVLNINSKQLTQENLVEGAIHTAPKVLFLYMPLFAFLLWLFHSKKKWYFFDHGIFTLHYFSFLLLLFTLCGILSQFAGWAGGKKVAQIVALTTNITAVCYAFFYFFRSHRKVYCEKRWVSRLKSLALFVINMSLFFIVLIITIYYIIIFELH